MLLKLINYLKGTVRLQLKGPYPERFLNLCSRNNVVVYFISRTDIDEMYVTIEIRDLKKVREFATKSHSELHITKRKGIPFFINNIKYRFALWGGAFVFLFVVYLTCTHVWSIDINAADGISDREINQNLVQLGVYPGVSIKEIDAAEIKNEMMLKMDNLSFFAINIIGNKAEIQAEKRVMKPEMIDEDTITSIVSDKTGVITKMSVKGGTALKKVGETVLKGDMLVTAEMKPINEEVQPFLSHSDADIEARTWYNIKKVFCLNVVKKEYSGKVKNRYSIVLGKKRINLLPNSGIYDDSCDKITQEKKVVVGDDFVLPIYIVKTSEIYYEKIDERLSADSVQKYMEKSSDVYIENTVDGEITTGSHTMQEVGDTAVLNSVYECLEKIGEQVIDDRTNEDLIETTEKEGV